MTALKREKTIIEEENLQLKGRIQELIEEN
jgi:hypothetical protein